MRLADEHVLRADVVAVGGFQHRDDVAELGRAEIHLDTCLKHTVQIGIAQVEIVERKRGLVLAALTHRVALSEQMPPRTVGIDQIENIYFFDIAPRPLGLVAILGAREIKPFKEFAPAKIHALGITQVLLIDLIDIAGIGIAQIRIIRCPLLSLQGLSNAPSGYREYSLFSHACLKIGTEFLECRAHGPCSRIGEGADRAAFHGIAKIQEHLDVACACCCGPQTCAGFSQTSLFLRGKVYIGHKTRGHRTWATR